MTIKRAFIGSKFGITGSLSGQIEIVLSDEELEEAYLEYKKLYLEEDND